MELKKKFMDGLRADSNLHIFWNLFSILELSYPDFLDEIVRDYKEYPEDWFCLFHKRFRQYDLIDSYRIATINPYITKEERQERINLIREMSAIKKMFNEKYPELQELYKSGGLENSGVLAEHEPELSKYLEMKTRRGVLNQKDKLFTIDENNPVAGYLDSIFWIRISEDDGSLYEYIDEFLESNLV